MMGIMNHRITTYSGGHAATYSSPYTTRSPEGILPENMDGPPTRAQYIAPTLSLTVADYRAVGNLDLAPPTRAGEREMDGDDHETAPDPSTECALVSETEWNRYPAMGGRRSREYPDYVEVMRDRVDGGVISCFPINEVPPTVHRCESCGSMLGGTGPRCSSCDVRARATATAIANGGRRFGIELEFSLSRDVGMCLDEEDDFDAPAAGHRLTNQMSPAFIATRLDHAGVPCEAPGYTHRIEPGMWKIVPDGSVEHGYELVSPPMQWAAAQVQVRAACQVLRDLGCHSTHDCGLHVHHDVGDMSVTLAPVLAHNWDTCYPQSARLVDPNRQYGDWCKPAPHRRIEQLRTFTGRSVQEFISIDHERYRPLNWTCWFNYGTVEVRMHESTLDADEILAWVAYTQSIIETSMSGSVIEPTEDFETLVDQRLTLRQGSRPAHSRALLKAKAAHSAVD